MYVDVSHNKVTNHGARLLSKLLGTKSVLTSLNLCDNQVCVTQAYARFGFSEQAFSRERFLFDELVCVCVCFLHVDSCRRGSLLRQRPPPQRKFGGPQPAA